VNEWKYFKNLVRDDFVDVWINSFWWHGVYTESDQCHSVECLAAIEHSSVELTDIQRHKVGCIGLVQFHWWQWRRLRDNDVMVMELMMMMMMMMVMVYRDWQSVGELLWARVTTIQSSRWARANDSRPRWVQRQDVSTSSSGPLSWHTKDILTASGWAASQAEPASQRKYVNTAIELAFYAAKRYEIHHLASVKWAL